MKVLILSCSTGQGHNSAAKAIYEWFCDNGVECEFKDAFSIVGDKAPVRASNIYSTIAGKAPYVFGGAYHIAGFISNTKVKSPVYAANMLWAGKVEQYIRENRFDVVLTSHLFVAQVLTHLKRKGRINVFAVGIMTDYTSSPFWEETELDRYMIPHGDLISEYVKRGLPAEKLIPTGIPVSNQYKRVYSKSEARTILRLPKNAYTILIMTGSMGFGHVEDLIDEILARLGENACIIVMSGNNVELKKKLDESYKDNDMIIVLEFTRYAGLYMDAADMLFTKPGGLSTTEAAVKNIPLVLTNRIPGCESKNVKFFTSHGLAYYASKPKAQARYAAVLKENPHIAKEMMMSQKRIVNPNAAGDICKYVMETAGERK